MANDTSFKAAIYDHEFYTKWAGKTKQAHDAMRKAEAQFARDRRAIRRQLMAAQMQCQTEIDRAKAKLAKTETRLRVALDQSEHLASEHSNRFVYCADARDEHRDDLVRHVNELDVDEKRELFRAIPAIGRLIVSLRRK